MAFGQLGVDQPAQTGFNRGLDGRSPGRPSGPLQEFVIDVDKTLRHVDEYILNISAYTRSGARGGLNL